MNLGQLIDAERVQQGLAADRPAQPAPLPPMGLVVRDTNQRELRETPREESGPVALTVRPRRPPRDGSCNQIILEAIAAEPVGATVAELRARLGDAGPVNVNAYVGNLLATADIAGGGPRPRRYMITEKGRARLKGMSSP